MVTERRTRLFIAAACVLGVAVGSYYFGAASSRNAERSLEAAGDLLVPVDDVRRTRMRREGIRRMLERLTEAQTAAHTQAPRYLPLDSLAADTVGYLVEVYSRQFCIPNFGGCQPDYTWLAVGRDRWSPIGEVCSVALNVEPTYVGGIPLKRAGRVRCSWDLSTRLNRLLW
jgi:hypothetical protein